MALYLAFIVVKDVNTNIDRVVQTLGCYDSRSLAIRAIFKSCVYQGLLDFDSAAVAVDDRFNSAYDIETIDETKYKPGWPFFYFQDDAELTDIIFDYCNSDYCQKTDKLCAWSYKIYKIDPETKDVVDVN